MSRKHKRMLTRILLSSVLLLGVRLLPPTVFPADEPWKTIVTVVVYLVPYLVAGADILWAAVRNLLHGQWMDEKFLMSVATIGAFAMQEYAEGIGVMIFFQVGELFQSIAVGRSRKNIASLMDIRPDTAVVIRDGKEYTVSPEDVQVGETILIRAGEKVPLDGTVLEGESSVTTAALTGESLPVSVARGDRVISGSVNGEGVLHVRTESVFADSTVARILDMVENASSRKAKVENFITRFARYYTPIVVFSALAVAIIPPLFDGFDFVKWISRALMFLVVSCPCALVVSVPLSFFGGIGGAARRGILVKGTGYFEALANIKTAVFDKTGTLTRGTFTVTEVSTSDGFSRDELLDIAAAAESRSRHPIALSVMAYTGKSIDSARLGGVTEHAGMGLEVGVDGRTVFIGNARLMAMAGLNAPEVASVGTVLHVAVDGRYAGYLVLADTPKPDAREALAALRAEGVERTVMLTGDRRAIGEAVAADLGITEARCELLPGDKVNAVEDLLKNGRGVAFVGDGINDAPVLARADIGVAMGALGSDAAIEAADVVLMDDKLMGLPTAIHIARRTMRIVHQNIVFALAVKIGVLLLSVLGIANMWLAVFADVGVLVLVILNAMRAMRVSAPKQ